MEDHVNKEFYLKQRKFWKFRLIAIMLSIGMLLVIVKLVNIQLISSSEYRSKAKRQHESKVNLSAERGKITDRNGRLIASTIKSISVAADPELLEDKHKFCSLLSEVTGISSQYYLRKINSHAGRFIWLKRGINPIDAAPLINYKDKGAIIVEEPRRVFNYGATAAQVVGLTNIDNQGLTGIELAWDSLLIGRNGYMIVNRDAKGFLHPTADLPVIDAINGYNLELTIDIELQRILEHELMSGVVNSNARSGTAIAIEPSTGDILAICSYPNFNPNNLVELDHASLKNKAITDIYEPGSTFKAITAAAAIEEGVVDENDTLNGYNGYYRGRGFTIRDVHGYSKLTFREAMEKSSNVVLGNVANMIPKNKFYKYIRDFGFGLKSGIDFPGEVTGKVPKPDKFTGATKHYLGHGYELSVTPLQLAMAYAAIANNGVLMRPRLIKSVKKDNGEIYKEFPIEEIRRVVSGKTAERVRDLCVGVVDSGTGTRARVEGLKIAGKTGTSQQLVDGRYSKSAYNASFAGFFPAYDPKVALVVVIDRPSGSYYGGVNAAPVFKNTASRWVNNEPLYDHEDEPESEVVQLDSIKMPNLIGMNTITAQRELESMGIDLEWKKNGIIIDHLPKPDSIISLSHTRTVKAVVLEEYSHLNKKNASEVNLKGLPLRRAAAVLDGLGVEYDVSGSGEVRQQIWTHGKNSSKCKLVCR